MGSIPDTDESHDGDQRKVEMSLWVFPTTKKVDCRVETTK